MTVSNIEREPTPAQDIASIEAMIAELAPDAQRRIAVVKNILCDLLTKDTSGESMLAFTLVMAELVK